MERLSLTKELLAPFAVKGTDFVLLYESEGLLFQGVVEKIDYVRKGDIHLHTLVVSRFMKLLHLETSWRWLQLKAYEISLDSRMCYIERRGHSLAVSRLHYRDTIVFLG